MEDLLAFGAPTEAFEEGGAILFGELDVVLSARHSAEQRT